MPIIDRLDNLSLIKRKKTLFNRVTTSSLVSKFKKKGCMPTSEQMKDCYVASVTHLKIK